VDFACEVQFSDVFSMERKGNLLVRSGRGRISARRLVLISNRIRRQHSGQSASARLLFKVAHPFSAVTYLGFIKVDRNENEVSLGILLERGDRRTFFISPHAAVQTDVWRNLFVSVSIQTVNQSRTFDSRLLPNRLEPVRDSFTDVYSNFGAGWRFKPNFIFQYIVTTDYGKTAPRHAFHFRYTFNFSRE
jgi:hypothetical protein